MPHRPTIAHGTLVVLWATLLAMNGCHSHHIAATTRPTTSLEGLCPPKPIEALQAIVCPPRDWKIIQKEETAVHSHWTWTSSSGDTAYGIVYVRLPLPIGADLTLLGFLSEMRQKEGDAKVLEKRADPLLPDLRFVAVSPIHKIRANLITHGFQAWVIYAGVLVGHSERPDELKLAERAREATITGTPE